MSCRKLRRGLEAGLCAGEEEAHNLEARVEGMLEELLKLQIKLAKDEWCNACRAEEVRALWDQSAA